MIILEPHLFKGFYQYDPDLGFRVRPYANGTNQFGFNDRDYPLQKESGTFRILILGDSFNWAGGLKGNYTALLETMLDDYCDAHRVDVINAGYPMTHTAEQLELLKKYAIQYNPDHVVLGFFIGNDFFDANPNRKRIVVNDIYVDIDKRKELVVFGYPIVWRSRVIDFVRQKYIIWKKTVSAKRRSTKERVSGKQEKRGTLREAAFLYIERSRLEMFNRKRHQAGEYNERMQYAFKAIKAMAEFLEAKGITFSVAIYPDEFQVDRRLLEQLFETFDLIREDYDGELLQKILRDYLDSLSIRYIDLLDRFRGEGNEKKLYKLHDTHWNDSGNELAAKVIFRHVMQLAEYPRRGECHAMGEIGGSKLEEARLSCAKVKSINKRSPTSATLQNVPRLVSRSQFLRKLERHLKQAERRGVLLRHRIPRSGWARGIRILLRI
jgi:hypothetical protein